LVFHRPNKNKDKQNNQPILRKSICFYTISHPMFGLGGAEIQSYYYAKEFANLGWKVSFLTKKGKEPIACFNNEGINIIYYKKHTSPLRTLLYFIKIIKKYKFDVVFYRNNTVQLGILAILSKIFNYKLIWSVKHDDFCGKTSATKKERLLTSLPSKIKQFNWLFNDRLFKYGVLSSFLVLAQNKYQKRIILKDFKKSSDILYSGTNIPKYNTSRMNQILFISTIRDFKRPELYCKLANLLSRKGYDFLLIGDNYQKESKKEHLLKLINNSKINYLGPQSLSEVQIILNRSKLLINTSVAEGFPNTFVQAFAHGVPVVSLDVNTDNLITDNNLGYYANGDLKQMASYICQLMDNIDVWKEKSENAYQFAISSLNISENTKRLITLIDS
jgi:glycosyltransferase involved in cell wall biosynthesis